MATHELKCQEQYIKWMVEGVKTVEGRVNDPSKWDKVKAGDKLHIAGYTDKSVEVTVDVLEKVAYKSFRDMLEGEGVKTCLPAHDSVDAGVELYRGFPGYKEGEQMYGALAIRIRLTQ